MALIDEHGRLFGRVNLIDAMVGLFVLVLVPLGYGAYALFRTPVPTITSITPAQVPEKRETTLEIAGTDLRPFLKAHLGQFEVRFSAQSPTKAEIKLPDAIPAGSYDLILSDESQELARRLAAVVLVAPVQAAATAQVQLLGEFVALSADLAKTVRVGAVLKGPGADPPAEVLAVRPALPGFRSLTAGSEIVLVPAPNQVRVPAIVRVSCVVVDVHCSLGGVPLAAESTVSLPLTVDAGQGTAPVSSAAFHVIAVRSVDAPAAFATVNIRVRFVARTEVVQTLKAGDIDVPIAGAVGAAERAVLIAIDNDRQTVTAIANVLVAPAQTYQVPQQAVAFTGSVRVPVVATASGWQYKNKPVKVGAPFSFETAGGFAQGWIADLTVTPAAPSR